MAALGVQVFIGGERETARSAHARVVVVTAQPHGEVPRAADALIHLKAQTMADDTGASTGKSALSMGSLYEAAMLTFLGIVLILLCEQTGRTTEGIRSRQTNLE